MTWKELKEAVEATGVKDSDLIFFIDSGNFPESVEVFVDPEKRYVQVVGNYAQIDLSVRS